MVIGNTQLPSSPHLFSLSEMASASLRISVTVQFSNREPLIASQTTSRTNLLLPRQPSPSSSVLTFSRRRHSSSSSSVTSKKHKKRDKPLLPKKDVEEDDDLDEDAFEALFRQLEEDLKNDDLSFDGDDDDISEEDLKKLEEELEEALKDDDLLAALGTAMDIQGEDEDQEEEQELEQEEGEELDDDVEEDENPLKLKTWQLRRLAQALKKGRRKISIKNLAADLCLDRAIILELLREPPPNLLMLSAALPDEPAPTILEPASKAIETVPSEAFVADTKPEVEEKAPVHVMQSNWSAQKRLKKPQLETLERVYRRTKRPTNAMISSIVHVTNLPRKRVLKWFEDKREEDGVPEHRQGYQPTASETANTI